MKVLRQLALLTLIVFSLFFHSCSLLDPEDTGGLDINLPRELVSTDFTSDLVVEDRNDGVDYVINSRINVDNLLEIKPGVVIEFGELGALDIRSTGSLQAIGAPDNQITFTGEIKSRGAWRGIIFRSSSLRNQLRHCIIEFAGKDSWGNGVQGGISTWADAAFNIDNCIFKSNRFAAIMTYDIDVEIRSLENNTFENNDKSIIVTSESAHQIGSGNVFTDLDNVIEIYREAIFGTGSNGGNNLSYTWKAHAAPYRITAKTVVNDNNLTIEPGTIIEFSNNGHFSVDNGGSLTAVGTASDPITFTGRLKQAGSWPGLAYYFSASANNRLEYCNIEFAGGTAAQFDNGVIYMWADPTLNVKNCSFTNIASCIYFEAVSSGTNENLTESNNSYQSTGNVFCN